MVDTVIRVDDRPRKRDRERTRRRLLDAALAEFSEKGLAGARVSAIAERAGVNKQLISYYFAGKRGLYDALVQQWLDAEAEFARPDLTLGQLVGAYVRSAVAHRAMSRIFLRESLEDVPDGERRDRPGGGRRPAPPPGGRRAPARPRSRLRPARPAGGRGRRADVPRRRPAGDGPRPALRGVRGALRRAARAAHRPPRQRALRDAGGELPDHLGAGRPHHAAHHEHARGSRRRAAPRRG